MLILNEKRREDEKLLKKDLTSLFTVFGKKKVWIFTRVSNLEACFFGCTQNDKKWKMKKKQTKKPRKYHKEDKWKIENRKRQKKEKRGKKIFLSWKFNCRCEEYDDA